MQKDIFQSFRFSEMLGEGSYGKVFLGHSIDPTAASKIKLPDYQVRNAYSNIDEQIDEN